MKRKDRGKEPMRDEKEEKRQKCGKMNGKGEEMSD